MSFSGARAFGYAVFGRGTGGIYLDNLGCRGSESRLIDCVHNGVGVHNCDHGDDAGLRCQRKSYLSRSCTVSTYNTTLESRANQIAPFLCRSHFFQCYADWSILGGLLQFDWQP